MKRGMATSRRVCAAFITTLMTGAMLASASSVSAQAITSGADKLLPRLCSNSCVQANESISVDRAGNALAIWEERESSSVSYITVARYTVATNSWSASRRLAMGSKPAIDIDGSGNALAVWDGGRARADDISTYNFLVYSRFSVAQGNWTPPTIVRDFQTYYFSRTPLLELGANGDGTLILRTTDTLSDYFIRFDAATGMFLDVDRSVPDPKLDTDPAGNTIYASLSPLPGSDELAVTLTRWNNDTKSAVFAGYLDRARAPSASLKILAATKDVSGKEMVLWQRTATSSTGAVSRNIRSARYIPSSGSYVYKDFPELNNNAVIDADMEADRFGNIHAVWTQYVGAYMKTVASRYSSSTGAWSAPRVISVGSFHTRDASLDVDASGNVIATWSQRTDTGTGSSTGKIFRTKAARYVLSSNTWGTPITIQDANRNGYKPFMGVSDNGRAVVLWNQDSTVTSNGTPVKELRSDRVFPQ